MRIKLLFIIFILGFCQLHAQISVAECTPIENDLDARNYPILDDEGSACALVKIVTTAKGFNFEIGQLPVKKVDENKVGEIWVYVPDGTMKMKITHPDLGSLRGADIVNGYYIFPQRLKRAKVYRLELTHKEVIKTVGPQIPAKITFESNVDGAEVIIGDGPDAKSIGQISNHVFITSWPKGHEIKYAIKKDHYKEEKNSYLVNKDENLIKVDLKPLFGCVTINSFPNAIIKINGNEVAKGTYNGNLDKGNYTVVVSLNGYKNTQKSFIVQAGENKVIDIYPEMIVGGLNIYTSPSGAEIFIDGSRVGVSPYSTNSLMIGEHSIEIKKTGYESLNKKIYIEESKISRENLSLTNYGHITITSNLYRSSVYINNRYVGKTPYNLSGPAGKYKIEITNDDYFKYTKNITLNSDSENINAHLHKILLRKNGLYFGFNGGIGSAVASRWSFDLVAGLYIYNFNFEYNYKGNVEVDDVIYLDPSHVMYMGYGLLLNHRFRLTPQTGIKILKRYHNYVWQSSKNYSEMGYSIPVSLKFDFAVAKWFIISLRPSYDIVLSSIGDSPNSKIGGIRLDLGFNFFIGWK